MILWSFVCDWIKEGEDERNVCYVLCLEVFECYFFKKKYVGEEKVEIMIDGEELKFCRKVRERLEVKVLVLGCGFGRLVMEIVVCGRFFLFVLLLLYV